jgi:hypothetical protein
VAEGVGFAAALLSAKIGHTAKRRMMGSFPKTDLDIEGML